MQLCATHPAMGVAVAVTTLPTLPLSLPLLSPASLLTLLQQRVQDLVPGFNWLWDLPQCLNECTRVIQRCTCWSAPMACWHLGRHRVEHPRLHAVVINQCVDSEVEANLRTLLGQSSMCVCKVHPCVYAWGVQPT